MSPRKWEARLGDIEKALAKIERYIEGLSEAQFSADEKTIDAVACNLEIVGEASHRLDAAIKAMIPKVKWLNLYDGRNNIGHEYFRRDLALIWKTITVDVPEIRAEIQLFLADAGTEGK